MMYSVSMVLSLALLGVVKSHAIVPVVADQCFEPVSPGPCRAFIPSFYFNPLTGECDCFIFGGCQANGNKFARLDECMSTCSVRPQLQTISPTCIRIFGADNTNFIMTPRPITPRPVTFSPATQQSIVTDLPVVPVKDTPTTTAPPTTSAPTKATPKSATPTTTVPAAIPTTAAPTGIPTTAAPKATASTPSTPVRPAAPVVPAAPARTTSNYVQTSGTTIKKYNLISRNNEDFEGTAIAGSTFSHNGVSGQTTITIGRPVSIGQRSSNDGNDKPSNWVWQ